MKKTLLVIVYFILLCSCKQPKVELHLNISNPIKPIVVSSIPNKLIDSLKININTIDQVKAEKVMALYLVTDNIFSTNKIIGNYFLKNDSLQFIPYFELGYGLNFEAQLYIDGDTIKKRFSTPQAPIITAPLTEAIQIFPLTDKIPTNILSFHAIFSSPMQEDLMAFSHVQLIDEDGKIKPKVWKEKSYWANDAKHLILMIHPGRIKRGIHYLTELGQIFEIGKKYTIVLTTALKDKYNRSLYKEYRKTFTAIAPDREIPKMIQSEFKIPTTNTKDPLQLSFSEAMDYGSLISGIKIYNEKNELIKGKITSINNDMIWNFFPNNPWKKELHKVEFNSEIGDLASNHLDRLFETKDIKEFGNHKSIQWNFIPN